MYLPSKLTLGNFGGYPSTKISDGCSGCVIPCTEIVVKKNEILDESKIEHRGWFRSAVSEFGGSSLLVLEHAPDQRAHHIQSLHARSGPGYRDRLFGPSHI